METRKLRRQLRKLAHTANERFPRLNYGGCCVFAAAVATELERMGVPHEVISSGGEHLDLNEVRPPHNDVDAWQRQGVHFGHVGVRLKLHGRWYTYDSDKPLHRGKGKFGINYGSVMFNAAKGGITAAEATELADDFDAWNSSFDHRTNAEPVRVLVKEMLA